MIKVRDFSRFPAGAKREDGEFSAERFREEILLPEILKLKRDNKLYIDLDGVMGYASSFLKEAFGGLTKDFSPEFLKEKIVFISKRDSIYIQEIWQYIEEVLVVGD